MAATNSQVKAHVEQQPAKLRKSDIGVGSAAQYPSQQTAISIRQSDFWFIHLEYHTSCPEATLYHLMNSPVRPPASPRCVGPSRSFAEDAGWRFAAYVRMVHILIGLMMGWSDNALVSLALYQYLLYLTSDRKNKIVNHSASEADTQPSHRNIYFSSEHSIRI